jgi:hypothetical protein
MKRGWLNDPKCELCGSDHETTLNASYVEAIMKHHHICVKTARALKHSMGGYQAMVQFISA